MMRARSRRAGWALLIAASLASLAVAGPAAALLDLKVTDPTIGMQSASPSDVNTGPIVHTASDGFTFSSGLTNIASIWYADLTVANNTTAASATMQGTAQTFSAWFFLKQNANSRYSPVRVVGAYDPAAGSYSVPLTFVKSSQGTLTFTSYTAASPVDGGSTSTYYWAYNAVNNRYLFGTTKSLSGTQYAPVSDLLGTSFARAFETNSYVITSVGGAPNHVPTLRMGAHLPLLSLPQSQTYYALMDTPPGVHEDTYTFTLTMTSLGL